MSVFFFHSLFALADSAKECHIVKLDFVFEQCSLKRKRLIHTQEDSRHEKTNDHLSHV